MSASLTRSYALKHFLACFLWQIQIEDHKVRTWVLPGFNVFDEFNRSLAVADHKQVATDVMCF